MIWLTWRQFRLQAVVIFSAIAAVAAALAATGPHLADLHRTEGDAFLDRINGTDTALFVLGALALLAVPAIIGMFWGAPLITRELDAGTHRLAWTQTTRTRWLVTKVGLIGLTAMAAAGLLSLAVTWWSAPIDAAVAGRRGRPGPGVFVIPRLWPELFDSRGIAPIGYAAFTFVLGVTVGLILRRTLPSMAVLLALFTVVQIGMSVGVRPNLMPPERRTVAITAADLTRIGISGDLSVAIDEPGAWTTSQHTVDASGRTVTPPSWVMNCPSGSKDGRLCFTRLTDLGYRQVVDYQPGDRFWDLQFREMVIYLAGAVLLAGLCTWWIRHRLS